MDTTDDDAQISSPELQLLPDMQEFRFRGDTIDFDDYKSGETIVVNIGGEWKQGTLVKDVHRRDIRKNLLHVSVEIERSSGSGTETKSLTLDYVPDVFVYNNTSQIDWNDIDGRPVKYTVVDSHVTQRGDIEYTVSFGGNTEIIKQSILEGIEQTMELEQELNGLVRDIGVITGQKTEDLQRKRLEVNRELARLKARLADIPNIAKSGRRIVAELERDIVAVQTDALKKLEHLRTAVTSAKENMVQGPQKQIMYKMTEAERIVDGKEHARRKEYAAQYEKQLEQDTETLTVNITARRQQELATLVETEKAANEALQKKYEADLHDYHLATKQGRRNRPQRPERFDKRRIELSEAEKDTFELRLQGVELEVFRRFVEGLDPTKKADKKLLDLMDNERKRLLKRHPSAKRNASGDDYDAAVPAGMPPFASPLNRANNQALINIFKRWVDKGNDKRKRMAKSYVEAINEDKVELKAEIETEQKQALSTLIDTQKAAYDAAVADYETKMLAYNNPTIDPKGIKPTKPPTFQQSKVDLSETRKVEYDRELETAELKTYVEFLAGLDPTNTEDKALLDLIDRERKAMLRTHRSAKMDIHGNDYDDTVQPGKASYDTPKQRANVKVLKKIFKDWQGESAETEDDAEQSRDNAIATVPEGVELRDFESDIVALEQEIEQALERIPMTGKVAKHPKRGFVHVYNALRAIRVDLQKSKQDLESLAMAESKHPGVTTKEELDDLRFRQISIMRDALLVQQNELAYTLSGRLEESYKDVAVMDEEDMERAEKAVDIPEYVVRELLNQRPAELRAVMEDMYTSALDGGVLSEATLAKVEKLFDVSAQPDSKILDALKKHGIEDWRIFVERWQKELARPVAETMAYMAGETMKNEVAKNMGVLKKMWAFKGDIALRVALVSGAAVGGGALAIGLLPAAVLASAAGTAAVLASTATTGALMGLVKHKLNGFFKKGQAKKVQQLEEHTRKELVDAVMATHFKTELKSQAYAAGGSTVHSTSERFSDEESIDGVAMVSNIMSVVMRHTTAQGDLHRDGHIDEVKNLTTNQRILYEEALDASETRDIHDTKKRELALAISRMGGNGRVLERQAIERLRDTDPAVITVLKKGMARYGGHGTQTSAMGFGAAMGVMVGAARNMEGVGVVRAGMGAVSGALVGYSVAEWALHSKDITKGKEILDARRTRMIEKNARLAQGKTLSQAELDEHHKDLVDMERLLRGNAPSVELAVLAKKSLYNDQDKYGSVVQKERILADELLIAQVANIAFEARRYQKTHDLNAMLASMEQDGRRIEQKEKESSTGKTAAKLASAAVGALVGGATGFFVGNAIGDALKDVTGSEVQSSPENSTIDSNLSKVTYASTQTAKFSGEEGVVPISQAEQSQIDMEAVSETSKSRILEVHEVRARQNGYMREVVKLEKRIMADPEMKRQVIAGILHKRPELARGILGKAYILDGDGKLSEELIEKAIEKENRQGGGVIHKWRAEQAKMNKLLRVNAPKNTWAGWQDPYLLERGDKIGIVFNEDGYPEVKLDDDIKVVKQYRVNHQAIEKASPLKFSDAPDSDSGMFEYEGRDTSAIYDSLGDRRVDVDAVRANMVDFDALQAVGHSSASGEVGFDARAQLTRATSDGQKGVAEVRGYGSPQQEIGGPGAPREGDLSAFPSLVGSLDALQAYPDSIDVSIPSIERAFLQQLEGNIDMIAATGNKEMAGMTIDITKGVRETLLDPEFLDDVVHIQAETNPVTRADMLRDIMTDSPHLNDSQKVFFVDVPNNTNVVTIEGSHALLLRDPADGSMHYFYHPEFTFHTDGNGDVSFVAAADSGLIEPSFNGDEVTLVKEKPTIQKRVQNSSGFTRIVDTNANISEPKDDAEQERDNVIATVPEGVENIPAEHIDPTELRNRLAKDPNLSKPEHAQNAMVLRNLITIAEQQQRFVEDGRLQAAKDQIRIAKRLDPEVLAGWEKDAGERIMKDSQAILKTIQDGIDTGKAPASIAADGLERGNFSRTDVPVDGEMNATHSDNTQFFGKKLRGRLKDELWDLKRKTR